MAATALNIGAVDDCRIREPAGKLAEAERRVRARARLIEPAPKGRSMSSSVSPFLWYDREAEEAAQFYVSLLPNSEILSVSRWGDGGPLPAGTAMSVEFTLDGVRVMALNAGPQFPFTEAFSFFVRVPDQSEVDRLWYALTANGGEESMCGWLKDRWGLSWQIVPEGFEELIGGPDPAKAAAAREAMFRMHKLDLAALQAAYDAG